MAGFLKNILWPTDFSPEAQEALRYAEFFARTFSAKITALHVAPDFMPAMYQNSLVIQKELIRRSKEVKNQAREQIQSLGRKKGIDFRKIIVTEGSAAKKIVETAEKEKVDLIVMGKKGQSALEKLLIGSVANHVLRHSPAPVLITKKSRRNLVVKKILVPTDFTEEEEVEREYAWNLAKGLGASLTLLYVLELFGHEFRLVDEMFRAVDEKFKKRLARRRRGVEVSGDMTKAISAAHGIAEYAKKHRFDLIVMATCVGRLGRFFLGSTTEKVISSTDLPVFAIPPKFCS
jgi:nucleotide-binding universal stress UspA family protein